MKLFRSLGVLGLSAVAGISSAAAPDHELQVNVPFSFVFAGQQFAAGEYVIKESESGVITVQGAREAAMGISSPNTGAVQATTSNLRFVNSGNREYLVGLQVEGVGGRNVLTHMPVEHKLAISSH